MGVLYLKYYVLEMKLALVANNINICAIYSDISGNIYATYEGLYTLQAGLQTGGIW